MRDEPNTTFKAPKALLEYSNLKTIQFENGQKKG